MDKYALEIHPFKDFIKTDTEYLIIGTFPSHFDNRNFEFFYSSNNNMFWKILEKIYDTKFKYWSENDAITEREKFLEQKKIGLTDMHYKCYRKNKSSSDDNLYSFEMNNIPELLQSNPSIKHLIFTSRTDAVGAYGLFSTYLRTHRIIEPKLETHTNKVKHGDWKYNGLDYSITIPYSTSPKVLEKGNIKFEEIQNMYYFCLP